MLVVMSRRRPKPISDRIRRARLELGLSQGQVSEETGLTQTSLSRYETGAANPSEPSLRLLGSIYAKSYEWFFGEEDEAQGQEIRTGGTEAQSTELDLDERHGDMMARLDQIEVYLRSLAKEGIDEPAKARAQAPTYDIAEVRADYESSNSDRSPVEVMEVASAAGVGAEVFDETPVGLLWFRNDWLKRHSIDPKQSNIISVRGPSMEPTLPDGCSILVDRKRREPQEGRIYVMRTEEGLVVKRLGLDEEGRWEIRRDSPDWRITPMSPVTEIIGEVRWYAVTV